MSKLSSADAPVKIARGFAARRLDGTEGLACISFVNNANQPATEVDVDVEILDQRLQLRDVEKLARSGSFAPGDEINGPTHPRDVTTERKNCVIDGEGSLVNLRDPFKYARAVAVSVRRVVFADGSSWMEPGANTW